MKYNLIFLIVWLVLTSCQTYQTPESKKVNDDYKAFLVFWNTWKSE